MFDLGGGTLDVSLLETADGRLRVLDHAGDNFLGGKDMDGALVDWAAAALARRGAGDLLGDRASARGRRALARLRAACEQAKIELSRAERAPIVVSGRRPATAAATHELEITRDELDVADRAVHRAQPGRGARPAGQEPADAPTTSRAWCSSAARR